MCDGSHRVSISSPRVIAAAQRYVPATMRSGITVCSAGERRDTPSTQMVLPPAPVIFAPHLTRNSARSIISGSRAALCISVRPDAVTAASIMFSVAPTDGNESVTLPPRIPPAAVHSSQPCSSLIVTPMSRSAARCRSIGLAPSSQPPGKVSLQRRVLPRTAPRNTMDDRISRIKLSGISLPQTLEASTHTVSPLRVHLHPRQESILHAASTSVSSGQLCRTHSPCASTHAASSGSALFFAPCTLSSPSSRRPPLTTSFWQFAI